MKSYIVRIELKHSNPLIWRKVIMPAGATFKMLHDIVQQISNFQGGYPSNGYHLFEFDLAEDGIRVTNDEEAYQEHQYYKKNKKEFAERLKNMEPEIRGFEEAYQERSRRLCASLQASKLIIIWRSMASWSIITTLETAGSFASDWKPSSMIITSASRRCWMVPKPHHRKMSAAFPDFMNS